MATICKVDFRVYNKELFVHITLLLTNNNHCDDQIKTKKKLDDKKTNKEDKKVTTQGKKIKITSRQPERRNTRSSIFTITLHLHPTIIRRSLFTGMEATNRDKLLKHIIKKSLEVLRVQSIFFSPPLQSVRKTIHTQDVQVYRDLVGPALGSSFRGNNSILYPQPMESL